MRIFGNSFDLEQVSVRCQPQLSVWSELKLEELVTKLALVAHIVPEVEVI